jgi:formylglycine-generating enzyme required for sulfatase activity
VEQEYWETIKESRDASDFQAYLKEYPQGQYAPLARIKLQRLETAGKTGSDGGGNAGGVSGATNTAGGAKPAAKPGAVVRSQMGMELVYVPAGSFTMGSENGGDETPVHTVTIREGFYMGKYEVTQAQWQAMMGDNPSKFKGDNLPVETVSWIDAQNFIQKLNALNDGFIYRLPTEAEWEYAARAGTTGDYAGNLDSMAWYGSNSGGKTHAGGTKQPNAFGLYDMHGNVWEWCQDWSHGNYNGAPSDGSAWESGGEQKYRVLRGGSWRYDASSCRSAVRGVGTPDSRDVYIGFRVVALARS